jgi:hypothetical protein
MQWPIKKYTLIYFILWYRESWTYANDIREIGQATVTFRETIQDTSSPNLVDQLYLLPLVFSRSYFLFHLQDSSDFSGADRINTSVQWVDLVHLEITVLDVVQNFRLSIHIERCDTCVILRLLAWSSFVTRQIKLVRNSLYISTTTIS